MDAPGGSLIAGAGGYLQFWNWRLSGYSSPPTPINFNYLDVALWELSRNTIYAPVWYSGCFGAMRRRGVTSDWKLFARVWWDVLRAPEIVLNQGDTLAVKLLPGSDITYTGNFTTRSNSLQPGSSTINQQLVGLPASGLGVLPQGSDFIPCYASPMCVWSGQKIIDNNQGDDGPDGIMVQDIVLDGDSLLYYLQDQSDVNKYNNYLSSLVAQGFIAGN